MGIKRAYDPPSPDDGVRILVDRLWPRGLRKESLTIDAWLRDVAPSRTLLNWFGHRPERWEEFRRRYHEELTTDERATALAKLREYATHGTLTLIYSARDETHNNAVVLAEHISTG